MKRLSLGLVFVLAALTPAAAAAADENSCASEVIAALRRSSSYDAGRHVSCRYDSEGRTILPRDDLVDGRDVEDLTVRTSDQDTVGDIIDDLEQPAVRPNLGEPGRRPSFTSAPDGLGGFVLRDDAGAVYNPPTDSQGNSTFYTNDGQVMRCHTSDAGVTTCD